MSAAVVKVCPTCLETKGSEDFHRSSRTASGFSSRCKPCASQASRDWHAENRERKAETDAAYRAASLDAVKLRNREYWFRSRYGLTLDEVDAMLARGCDVCGSFENLHIDHDHTVIEPRESVRGVLCMKHNTLEGMLAAEEHLDELIAYTRTPPGIDRSHI
jgi:hypothetical protein